MRTGWPRRSAGSSTASAPPTGDDPQVAVERGGVTRFVHRSDISYVEAHGDYARLHTGGDSHLVRTPLATLEEEWAGAGFVRIHRSLLVSLAHVREVRMDGGRCTVVVGDPPAELGVSRRHTRELRELLLQNRTAAVTRQPPPERVRVTGPPRRRTPVARTADIDDETRLGGVYMGSLLREQLRLALGILLVLALTVGLLPLVFHLVPGPRRRRPRSGCRWRGCCSASPSTRRCCCSAGSTYGGPSATSATSPS